MSRLSISNSSAHFCVSEDLLITKRRVEACSRALVPVVSSETLLVKAELYFRQKGVSPDGLPITLGLAVGGALSWPEVERGEEDGQMSGTLKLTRCFLSRL